MMTKNTTPMGGNAGRDMMGTRTFRAASFKTIVKQVVKAYGPIPENAR
jgi:hypothetical protein